MLLLKTNKKLLVTLLTCLLLQGCVNTAITGAQAVYNHRNIQNSVNDQYINLQIMRATQIDTDIFKQSNLSVTTFNANVLLIGQIATAKLHQQLLRIVKSIPGIIEIHDFTTIGQPTSQLTRLNDSWMTTKIKTELIAINDVDPSQIKVVTENSTVYLMGTVYRLEAEIAVDIAENIAGVQRVVKIFSYLHVTKK